MQECFPDGSGWGNCECNLVKECEVNEDCRVKYGEDYWCDRTVWQCKEIDCIPDCIGKCCGSDGCNGTCPGNCPNGYTCNQNTCMCDHNACCPGAPQGGYHIDVAGTIVDITTSQGVRVAVAPISPMDALTNPDPVHLEDQLSETDGTFQTDCFDVTEVALGCIMLVDDLGFDGIGGNYFPTGTGVKSWERNAEKVCVEDSKAFAVPAALVTDLNIFTDVSTSLGFVMGTVVDNIGNPVVGAVITKGDGTDLEQVYYPSADFGDLTSRTSTSPNGAYVLPARNFAVGIVEITAEKAGTIFKTELAAPKPYFCYFVVIQEDT